jgi:hypothetical protein
MQTVFMLSPNSMRLDGTTDVAPCKTRTRMTQKSAFVPASQINPRISEHRHARAAYGGGSLENLGRGSALRSSCRAADGQLSFGSALNLP